MKHGNYSLSNFNTVIFNENDNVLHNTFGMVSLYFAHLGKAEWAGTGNFCASFSLSLS